MRFSHILAAAAGAAIAAVSPALAGAGGQTAPASCAPVAAAPVAAVPSTGSEWPEAWIEQFKLAPGKQEEFIRRVARADMVAAAGGQPPIQMFFHEDGSDWDVILYKPVRDVKPSAAQEAAMAAKRKEFNMASGPAYFLAIRETIAAHSDSKAIGPISAGQWLARLDGWRAEHPGAK